MRNAALALLVVLPGFALAQTTPLPGAPTPPPAVQKATPGTVVVEVRHDGKPVATANVTLDDGKRKQDVLIDPSSQGDAEFSGVKPGKVTVTVKYRAKGQDAPAVTQIFDVKGAGDATPHVTVALPGDAETITSSGPAGPPAGATNTAPATTVKPDSSGGFNFVGTLFALLVGGAAAAGIWYYIKQNPDTVGGTLEKLGAQIPKPGDAPLADPAVAAAPAPVAPEPPQKIVLDPAPSPVQLDPIAMPTAVAVSEPSLVSEAGVPIPLSEGETVVGREVGLGLSLAGETTVSRRHARIVRTGNTATIFDEGSTNGTFVNGQRIAGSTSLQPGDAVQFGSVRFRYEA